MPAARTSTAVASSLAAALLAGCVSNQNDSNALARRVPIEAYSPDAPSGLRAARIEQPDPPSLRTDSFSREHWTVSSFALPLDGTAHQPTYDSGQPHYARELRKQRGEYPDERSSLDQSTQRSALEEIAEGFAAPAWAAFDLGLMPVRMFLRQPFSDETSPTDGYERVPARWTKAVTVAAPSADAQAPATTPTSTPAPTPTAVDASTGVTTPGTPVETAPAPATNAQRLDVPERAAPLTVPPGPTGPWIFKDGHWVPLNPPIAPKQ